MHVTHEISTCLNILVYNKFRVIRQTTTNSGQHWRCFETFLLLRVSVTESQRWKPECFIVCDRAQYCWLLPWYKMTRRHEIFITPPTIDAILCIWVVAILRFVGSFSPSRKERKRDLRIDTARWTPGFLRGRCAVPSAPHLDGQGHCRLR